MVFPVVGGDGKPTGYEIENSLRFNNPDDPNLSTTFSSAGNRRTFTISAWVKRGNIADDHTLFGQGGTSAGNPRGVLFFANSLRFTNNTSGSSTDTDVETSAKTRDPSAWYHAVVAVDTTQGTAADRVKLYLNGEQQTDLANSTYPSQNFEMGWNNNVLHTVGRYPNNDAYHMDGYISEFYFIDGTQYAASNFGEFNDNGVWIPKDASGDLTFGTNGFYLEFKQTGTGTNSSGMGADTSGNDNHLAVNNLAAIDVTTDTPTNNFCVLNSISYPSGLVTNLTEGMLNLLTTDSPYGAVPATFALTNGKWYWEIKVNTSSDYDRIGLVGTEVPITTSFDFGAANLGGGDKTNLSYKSNDGKTRKDGTDANYGNTYTSGDIIGVAYNADDGEIYFYKNGTVQNSGTAAYTNLDGLTLMPAVGDGVSNAAGQYFCNFGNPTFSISSGNADANGYGNFEYAVPSGYYSLCTKNLAEYG